MDLRKRSCIAVTLLAAACASPAHLRSGDGWPTPPPDAIRTDVTRVVDGDTVVLGGVGHARLIGVDTPEVRRPVECYGREASAFTKRALDGRSVRVSYDVDRTDRYRRALVYLWVDGTFFNASLVAEGYAQQLTVPPNVQHAELFSALVREAREAGRGLWGSACPR